MRLQWLAWNQHVALGQGAKLRDLNASLLARGAQDFIHGLVCSLAISLDAVRAEDVSAFRTCRICSLDIVVQRSHADCARDDV